MDSENRTDNYTDNLNDKKTPLIVRSTGRGLSNDLVEIEFGGKKALFSADKIIKALRNATNV